MLLDLYMRRRPESVSVTDAELVDLSALLSRRAKGDAAPAQQWRSPGGLRARTSVFRALDPAVDTVETKRTAISDQVWAKFSSDAAALADRASQVRMRFQEAHSEASTQSAPGDPAPSRGPVAWAGSYNVTRVDGDRWVYLMMLKGGSTNRDQTKSFIKIGRTGNLARRRRELNFGFPSDFGWNWVLVEAALFSSESDAEVAERLLLSRLHADGYSAGREYGLCREDVALAVFAALKDIRR